MKRLNIITALAFLIVIAACEKEEKDPVLTDMTVQELITPVEGSSFVITKEILDSNFVITWDSATYSLNLSNPTYIVQLDSSGGTFSKPKGLANTTELSAAVKYSALNKILVDFGADTSVPFPVKIRVLSNIAGQLEQISGEVSFNMTAYFEPPVIDTTPDTVQFVPDTVYLVGSATLALWDATKGLPMVCTTADSVYTITTDLTTGGMKVLKYFNTWAPQWGDDGNFDGGLKFRPDEKTTDPPEIPSPGTGTYKIDIDIINLTYTISPV